MDVKVHSVNVLSSRFLIQAPICAICSLSALSSHHTVPNTWLDLHLEAVLQTGALES